MDNSISEKYFIPVLVYILRNGRIKKYDLKNVVKSSNSIDKLISKLSNDGFIEIKEEMLGRRTYTISLTEKGKIIAEHLKELEDIINNF